MMASYPIWVCQDCMLHHANGECGSCSELYGPHDEEPWKLYEGASGEHVTMGLLWKEHDTTCARFAHRAKRARVPDDYECDCEEKTCSTSRCDGCGSYLHGQRYGFTVWGK